MADIEVLSQLIDDESGHYRLRVGCRVHYLEISADVFGVNTMRRPHILIPKLPPLPTSLWTAMAVFRTPSGAVASKISTDPLPGVQTVWHERRVDVLSLKRTICLRSGVHEVLYNDAPAIAKIACFPWDIRRIEAESWAYGVLAHHKSQHPYDEQPPIVPISLGHLTENGRVMGISLEKVDGEAARIADLADCEAVLPRLHGIGLVHGDPNRHNFVVDRGPGGRVARVRLVDFEHADEFDEERGREDLLLLPAELAEETGPGATVVDRS